MTARVTQVWLAGAALVLAIVLAYAGSTGAPFVFDDLPAIVENPSIRDAGKLRRVLAPGQHGGVTVSGRPVVNLSLALNHAAGGLDVRGYHVMNILIHAAAALCLLGVVRRTCERMGFGRQGSGALLLGAASAALWALHPLQTGSVTYVVQRAESLMGLFYLLTVYGFVRGVGAEPGRTTWFAGSVVACALGMATKEVMVSAPVIVLLYDRTFVSGTFRAAWARHSRYYVALGCTWGLLAVLVLSTGSRGGTAGFDTGVSSWSYALTQCRAIVRYLALGAWPWPLVFDYGLATVKSLTEVFVQAVVVVGLFIGACVALRRCPKVGFLGAWFFALLAPSSSFVPVITQTMAEHRMYLPLAAPVVGLVFAAYSCVGRRALWWCGVVAGALAVATAARNRDYRSELVLWADTAAKHPTNARAHNNLGQALYRARKVPEAIASYRRALELQPNYPETHYNLGVALAGLDRLPEAIGHYETALRIQRDYPEAHNNLANALVRAGRLDDARRHYEEALARRPEFAEAHNNLGNALLQAGQPKVAAEHFRRALELKRGDAETHYNLGNAHAALDAMPQALAEFREALRLKAGYAEAHVNAGNALLALERPNEAVAHYEKAIAANPRLADAHYNLGSLLLQAERWSDAIPRFEAALALNPDSANAHRALGVALVNAGRVGDAIPHYERYLAAVPADAEARAELAQLRARSGLR